MNIITCYQTKNPCYQKGTPMKPVGIVVHSTGANNPNLCRYVDCPEQLGINRYGNHWNREDAQTLVHGAVGRDKNGRVAVVNTLPYTMAAWGVGGGKKGSYNYDPTGHIQFEMLEDDLKNRAYLDEVLAAAVEYCVLLCREYGLTAESIVSHREAHALGYASNHGDPENWLNRHGLTMDNFRARVQEIMEKSDDTNVVEYAVVRGDSLARIARRYGTTWQELAAYNGIANPSLIRVGQIIRIPVENAPEPEPEGNPYTEPIGLLRMGSKGLEVMWVQWELDRLGYECGDIDGIWGDKTEAAVEALQQAAGIKVDGIVGPDTITALKAAETPKQPTTYTVVSGDSLSRIGSKLGVSWRDIAAANNITEPWIIRPGQVLIIPGV